MKLDMKMVLSILTLVVSLAGFYYTTQMRLDNLEAEVAELKAADSKLKRLINKKTRKP